MNSATVARARSMYDACPTPKPAWDQLGGVTQGVWIERAAAEVKQPPAKPAPKSKFAKYLK